MRARGALELASLAIVAVVGGLTAAVLRRTNKRGAAASASEVDALRSRVEELEVQLDVERTIRKSAERKSFADRTGSNPSIRGPNG